MEIIEINESYLKYPELDTKIKEYTSLAYSQCVDQGYDIVADIEIRSNEIFNDDIRDHKEEMLRIEKLLKDDQHKKNEIYHMHNLNNKEFKLSSKDLFFTDDEINTIKAIHENKLVNKLINSQKQKNTIDNEGINGKEYLKAQKSNAKNSITSKIIKCSYFNK